MRCTRAALALGLATLGLPAALHQQAGELGEDELRVVLTHSPLGDPRPDPTNAVADDPAAARLGQRLFFDTRLSANGEISCATCHDPAKGLTDGKPVAEGLGVVDRSAPTLWNVAYQRWLFWDGRADSLWAQALQPTEAELEMGGSREQVARLLATDPTLRAEYEQVFGNVPDGQPVDDVFASYGKALAAYQRRLISRRSPFDVFVEGLREEDPEKRAALSPSALRGLRTFVGKGRCRMCHAGPNFSDGEFHATGVAPRNGGDLYDPGRYDGIAKVLADPFNALGPHSDEREGAAAEQLETLRRGPEVWGEFRTPTLRNVALTAPYMHQGQFATLAEVVRFYSTLEGAAPPGHHQEQVLQPLELSRDEQADLVAFLESLTDTGIDPELLAPLQ
jgi:cytochrome c peroxidase